MHSSTILTVLGVLFFTLVLIYRIQALHQKKVWHLSLQQLIYLVLIPGIVFPMIFSYLQSTIKLPRSNFAFIPDSLLLDTILLCTMYSYGGIAIHAVTKMFSDFLRNKDSEIAEINKFFHLKFSHNLIYSGIIIASLGITLLELNHIPDYGPASLSLGILKGVALSISFALFIYYYTRTATANYRGYWGDLKLVFGIVWIAFSLLLYIIQRFDIGFTEYQLLLPMFLSFSVLAGMSLILVFRRLKNGTFRLNFKSGFLKIFTLKKH